MTKEKEIEKLEKKYYRHLEIISTIGDGSMYFGDLSILLNKSVSQISRDIAKMEELRAVSTMYRDNKKVATILSRGYQILEKDNPRKLRNGTTKLITSSINSYLYSHNLDFFLLEKQQEIVDDFYLEICRSRPELVFKKEDFTITLDKKNKEIINLNDLYRSNIYLTSYNLQEKSIDFVIVFYTQMEQQDRMLKYVEDIIFTMQNQCQFDTKINVTIYTPYSTRHLQYKLLRAFRRYRKTRPFGNIKSAELFKQCYINFKEIKITHTLYETQKELYNKKAT